MGIICRLIDLTWGLQFIPVVKVVNEVLNAKPPEEIIWSISQLAETSYDWELIQSWGK